MPRVWPIISVDDVRKSGAWYAHLLGPSVTRSGSADFEQLLSEDFEVLVCLRAAESQAGASGRWPLVRASPEARKPGIMLWFVVEDFESAWERAREVEACLVEEPSADNGTGLRAFVVLDPDGYYVAFNEASR